VVVEEMLMLSILELYEMAEMSAKGWRLYPAGASWFGSVITELHISILCGPKVLPSVD